MVSDGRQRFFLLRVQVIKTKKVFSIVIPGFIEVGPTPVFECQKGTIYDDVRAKFG